MEILRARAARAGIQIRSLVRNAGREMDPAPANKTNPALHVNAPTPIPRIRGQGLRAKTTSSGKGGAGSCEFLLFPLPVEEKPRGPRKEEKQDEEPVGKTEAIDR